MKTKLLLMYLLLANTLSALQPIHNHETQEYIQVELRLDEPAYDEFDSATDVLIEKGHTIEQPKELSRGVILLRKVGGTVFTKYLAVKQWIKGSWQKLVSNNVIHAENCPLYRAKN